MDDILNKKVLDSYKPFRNQISEFSLLDSLYVIWAYAQNLQFDVEIPYDIECQSFFRLSKDQQIRRAKGAQEWELEFIANEIILNCIENRLLTKSLKQNKYFIKTINKLRKLEDEHYKISQDYFPYEDENEIVLLNLNRIAHRQFPWQSSVGLSRLYRYYQIYNDSILNRIIENIFGLSCLELMQLECFLVVTL